MINGSINQEDTAILNVYEPNNRTAKTDRTQMRNTQL